MGFSYTIQTPPICLGNRRAYKVSLTDVANDGTSKITGLPFKKITGYMIEETSTGTSFIKVSLADSAGGNGKTGVITLTSSSGTEDGEILVTGLL